MEYQYADLSNRLKTEIKRLETQISRDTGRRVVLIAYEGGARPTPVFGDVQESGSAEIKRNVFGPGGHTPDDKLYGNITQWHI
jgi:hypothetical protein